MFSMVSLPREEGKSGGNDGYRHVNGAVTVLAEMAHRSSVLGSGKESNASSAL